MKRFFFSALILLSVNVFAQANTALSNLTTTSINTDLNFAVFGSYGTHNITTNSGDNLVLQTSPDSNYMGGGLNILSGSNVQIQSGGYSPIVLSTSNTLDTEDIDLEASGGVGLLPAAGMTAYVGGAGLQLETTNQPSCSSGYQGTLYYVAGASGVADKLQVCMKAADDSFSWHTVP